MIETVIAASASRISPLYKAYKERVEAAGGSVVLTNAQMRALYLPMQYGPYWMLIVSGRKAGKLFSVVPNAPAGDLSLSRSSKATAWDASGKLIELVNDMPVFDWLSSGQFQGWNVSPQVTNYIPSSQSASYIGSGGSVLENPYTWGFTNLYTHSRHIPADGTTRRAFKQVAIANGTYCFSCFVKMDDLSVPNPGVDFQINISGSSSYSSYGVQLLSDNTYLVWRSGTVTAAGDSAHGMQRTTSGAVVHSGKGFRVTGYQLNEGAVPLRHVVTNGTMATKLYDNSQTAIAVPMDNVVLYVRMTNNMLLGTTGLPMGFTLRQDSSNYITVGFTSSGMIGMAIVVNNVVVFQINGPSAGTRIAARFVSGSYALSVNGVLYSAASTGSQNTTSPFGMSSLLQLGHSNRNITIRQAAILSACADRELAELTI